MTIWRTCMVTRRTVEELQGGGGGRRLSPSHLPHLHPSLVPPQDSSSGPHLVPWDLASAALNPPVPGTSSSRLVHLKTGCSGVLAAQGTAQLHTGQLQKVAATARFGSHRCRLVCDVCVAIPAGEHHTLHTHTLSSCSPSSDCVAASLSFLALLSSHHLYWD